MPTLPALDRREDRGPFDIIGDVHGCAAELERLLTELGYEVRWDGARHHRRALVSAPHGRKVVFVGDLVNRGPDTPDVARLAMGIIGGGIGYAVCGNHDRKLLDWLKGEPVQVNTGLRKSIEQLASAGREFRALLAGLLSALPSHVLLDEGRLVVAHAGILAPMIGQSSQAVTEFCLYGPETNETDADGLPKRVDWASRYDGEAAIAYGHTPMLEAVWINDTICLDTGCVAGNRLTALRWPEREIVSVPALAAWSTLKRPLISPKSRAAHQP